MRRKLRSAVRLLAVGVLTVLMTGCLKLDMDLQVSPDNTVSGSVIFAVDKQLLELTGGSFEDAVAGESPLPAGIDVKTEDYEDDNFVGQKYEFDGVPLEAFNTPDDPEALNIVREGDTFEVSGVLDMSNGDTTGLGDVTQEVANSAEIRVSITFPGPVESGSGEIDGNTVTWTPTLGERTELTAVASAIESGGGGTLWLILGGVAILVVLVVVAVGVSRRGKGRGEAVAAAGDADAPAADADAPATEAPAAAPESSSGDSSSGEAGGDAPTTV